MVRLVVLVPKQSSVAKNVTTKEQNVLNVRKVLLYKLHTYVVLVKTLFLDVNSVPKTEQSVINALTASSLLMLTPVLLVLLYLIV